MWEQLSIVEQLAASAATLVSIISALGGILVAMHRPKLTPHVRECMQRKERNASLEQKISDITSFYIETDALRQRVREPIYK